MFKKLEDPFINSIYTRHRKICTLKFLSKEINPPSLEIYSTIELIEKINPFLYFTASCLEKFKNENNNIPNDIINISTTFLYPEKVNRRLPFYEHLNQFPP